MVLGQLGQQVPLGDLQLLILGVAGDADDLHAVQQRLGHVQAVGRGDEHHVGQVIVDLQVMVGEGRVLFRIQHLEQGRGRVAPPVGAHLLDLVEQEEGVGGLGLLHRLDDLAGHRADVGAAVTADLGLVPHPAERQPHEFAVGRLGDRAAQRGLADARRADQAEDRALQRAGALLHGQVFQDAFLDLLQAIVVVVQDLFGLGQVDGLGLGLAPRDRQQPVEIVAHHRALGRHRAHVAQLLQLALGLGAGLLGQLGLLDALFQLDQFVARVVLLAQLALDRLHLLVQIIFALGLLHLPLHAAADFLLDLQDADLAFHQRIDLLQPLHDVEGFDQLLLVGDLHRQVLGDGVGQMAGLGDVGDGGEVFRRNLLVQLHIVFELIDHRPRQGLGLMLGAGVPRPLRRSRPDRSRHCRCSG